MMGTAGLYLSVTNDYGATFLYHNRHDGTFEDVGSPSGTGLGPDGQGYGNMAGDFGDFDRDGKLLIYLLRELTINLRASIANQR